MKTLRTFATAAAGCGALILVSMPAWPQGASSMIGERPAVEQHLDQAKIENGEYNFNWMLDKGQILFDARFNSLDGQGRPGSQGHGAPRVPGSAPAFIRTSAPEANSCSGCHAQPISGGSGDFVANVFVLAQALDPVTESVNGQFSNERNTLGMFGAGAIEMLAREMSDELIAIRTQAATDAEDSGQPVTLPLLAKGVDFGEITVMPDGRVDPTGIEGVDWDLIVKPFHQKGAVVSIREFTNNAMNHHHGMQAVERFGVDNDADMDGVLNELTVGDITASTLWQAALPAPNQLFPKLPVRQRAVLNGEQVFESVGCAGCHRTEMTLSAREFTEPNPYNPPGNLQLADVENVVSFDLLSRSKSKLVRANNDGGLTINVFTDLKRHNLNDEDYSHFDNEQVAQGSLVGFADPGDFTIDPEPRPTGDFLTRKLWDVGNSDPYGHRGDLTTMTEAIYYHGGDARAVRDAYFALSEYDQDSVIEYLKTFVQTHPGLVQQRGAAVVMKAGPKD